MFTMIAIVVLLFWIFGIVIGILSTIYYMELEEVYILQPAKKLVLETKKYAHAAVASVVDLFKRASRFASAVATDWKVIPMR